MEKTGSPAWTKVTGDEKEPHGNRISVWRYTLRSRHAICKKIAHRAYILLFLNRFRLSWSAIVQKILNTTQAGIVNNFDYVGPSYY